MLQKIDEIQIKNVIFAIFLILPFSYFFFNKQIDIWHAQGYFLQLGILALFSLHIFKNNKPLGFLILWIGLSTGFLWINIHIKTNNYTTGILYPFFNFLSIVILYEIIIQYLTKIHYERILKYLSYGLVIILIYGILQKLNLDQFFANASSPEYWSDNIVGTIGNEMHFAHYLTIMLPIFFIQNQKLLILLTLFVICLTGSLSALVIAFILIIFFSFYHRVFTNREWILLALLGLVFICYKRSDIGFLSTNGRIEIWKKYLPILHKKFITGWGLGFINIISKEKTFEGWRHLHNEYYHYLIELGFIGLSFIGYGIFDYFRKFKNTLKDNLTVGVSCIFLGFCLVSILGYPSHLWLTSSMGILSYSFMYLKEVCHSN